MEPTNLQLFLEYNSNHPTHCKNAIVYCQALRVVERCSEPGSAEPHLDRLREKFVARKYPVDLVEKQFQRAREKDRKSLIFQKRKEKNKDDKKVRLIFTHNRGNPPLHAWIRGAKKCLVRDEKAREMGKHFQICYKQPRNLKSMVTHIRKPCTLEENPGCSKCGRCKVSCPVLVEGGSFRSTNTQ